MSGEHLVASCLFKSLSFTQLNRPCEKNEKNTTNHVERHVVSLLFLIAIIIYNCFVPKSKHIEQLFMFFESMGMFSFLK